MEIEEIEFKSIPKNWKKEMSGLKPNTLRRFHYPDPREQQLKDFMEGKIKLNAIIENTHTGEKFSRTVTDVTYHEGWYIISFWWKR